MSPAEHTRYCYRQLKPGTYDVVPFKTHDVQCPPFWNALSRAGKKVAVIDVPKTFPSPYLNGLHIVDWGTHDPEQFGTWPPTLAEEIVARFKRDQVVGDNCNGFRHEASEFIALRDALNTRAAGKTTLSSHFLNQGGWDCFLTVYSESHCVGHQCWHLRDHQHPRHDPAVTKKTGDVMQAVYMTIDREMGKLLDQVGDDCVVIVLASHGMGPHYDGTFLLDAILQRLESKRTVPVPTQRAVSRLRKTWKKLPHAIRRWASPFSRHVKAQLTPHAPPLHQRKWFPVPNNNVYGAIRINLKGREPHGLVEPGAPFERVCNELADDLMRFTNVETNAPVVKNVLRTSDLYKGSFVDHLPDLLVEWHRDAPMSRIVSPKTGIIEGKYTKCRTGDHKAQGLFCMTGPGIKRGQVAKPISIMDFAPTIGDFLGVHLGNLEGKSFRSLVT